MTQEQSLLEMDFDWSMMLMINYNDNIQFLKDLELSREAWLLFSPSLSAAYIENSLRLPFMYYRCVFAFFNSIYSSKIYFRSFQQRFKLR